MVGPGRGCGDSLNNFACRREEGVMNKTLKHVSRSSLFPGLVVTLVALMVSAGAWLLWSAAADGTNTTILSAAKAAPVKPAEVRARAAETAEQVEAALAARTSGDISVRSDPATGSLGTIRAGIGGDLYPQAPGGATPQVKMAGFLAEHGALFGVHDPANQLKLLGVDKDQYGYSHVRYQQLHGKIPVLGAELKGHVSPDGRLTAVNGKFIPDIDVPDNARIARPEASESALARVAQQQPTALKDVELSVKSASLVVYRTNLTRGAPGENHLAYEVQVTGAQHVREFVYIDALTGKLVDQVTAINSNKSRRVHEGNIAAPPAWQEGDVRPAAHPAHEDEVSGAGQTYNLFFNLSGGSYRSWDGNDATMITVNDDPTIVCPNANWNGTSTNYCIGTSADDVVAHEWTHAYTQETSGLIYSYQSGALNESYSDVFGETVDLINNREGVEGTAATGNDGPRSSDDTVCSTYAGELNSTDESIRWLIGEDAFAFSPLPPIGDAAIRDMWRPRCGGGAFFLGNPGHGSSDLYHCDASDAGGVHYNSSINNRAYALLVDGDTVELKDDGTAFANPVTVTGIGLTKAAHIFWRANSLYNGPASNFADNADSLLMACEDLTGVNLTKLVTAAENGVGFLGANDDTLDPAPELSGEVITAADCQQVANAIAAVEMRHDVTKQCGFTPPLDPAPAPMCGGATIERQFAVDWESGIPAGWTIGQTPLTKSQLDTRPWFLRSGDLPKGRAGSAMFQENRVDLGNCANDDESGVLFMISPEITVAADDPGFLMFEHYFLTESGYDGGNLMISINGGIFTPVPQLAYSVVPGTAFVHNAYNGSLNGLIDQNTNPKRDEEAFHGSNPVSGDNDWGQSQVDLAAAGVAPGDTIRLRWDFGQDGCNGNEGWYVDRVEVFSCGDDAPAPTQECTAYPADILVASPISNLLASVTTATVSGAIGPVQDVNIRNLEGLHTWMGDLTFTLQSPSGTTITLFNGASCAGQDGISAEFDDAAATVIGCSDWLSGGSFKPFEALAAFNGEQANGDWTLRVTDAFPQDEGALTSWSLEQCRDIPPPPEDEGDQATGGGWLADNGGGKINFGFHVERVDDGFNGELQLSDKGADVKIDLTTVTSLGPVEGSCGAITDNARTLQIRGTGKFNKNASASFRVCVEDNGEPGNSNASATPDRIHVECTAGCSYSLATRVPDDTLDAGNLQVQRANAPASQPSQPGASTLILNPVLMTEGLAGALQLLEVNVFGSDQQPLAGESVSLTSVSATGATQTVHGIAGSTGSALFNVTLATKTTEYQAASGNVGSNAVHITPVLKLP
jgi:Zn-dependent metalloprotease/subtilisin-like proprotein convertase family protein